MRKLALILSVLLLTGIFLYSLYGNSDSKAASAELSEGVSMPAVMYHSVLMDRERTGDYVITPESLEEDLKYLKSKGYTSVTPKEIADYADGVGEMPEKPVLITFDDGHLNNMTYALPLLEKYHMKAVVNVTGAFSVQSEQENDPNPSYAYLTQKDAALLSDGNIFYVGCHTYNMHSLNNRQGASRMDGESVDEYTSAFADDTDRWTELFGESLVYAFPYGLVSKESYPVLESRGFRIVLTCRETGNVIYGDGSMRNKLVIVDRYNRSGLVQTDEFMRKAGIM